jgi:hypothetical protein
MTTAKRTSVFRWVLSSAIVLATICGSAAEVEDCTAAAIASVASANHRAMLWKNRDTGELSNRVVFVKESRSQQWLAGGASPASNRLPRHPGCARRNPRFFG